MHAHDEEVDGVGRAAIYSVAEAAVRGAAIVVLLSGGRHFIITTSNRVESKPALLPPLSA